MLLFIGQLEGRIVEEIDKILQGWNIHFMTHNRGNWKKDFHKETGHGVTNLLLLHLQKVLPQFVQECKVAHKFFNWMHLLKVEVEWIG